jgi:hypothetical protein
LDAPVFLSLGCDTRETNPTEFPQSQGVSPLSSPLQMNIGFPMSLPDTPMGLFPYIPFLNGIVCQTIGLPRGKPTTHQPKTKDRTHHLNDTRVAQLPTAEAANRLTSQMPSTHPKPWEHTPECALSPLPNWPCCPKASTVLEKSR